MSYKFAALVISAPLCLSACGGGTSFPVINAENAVLEASETAITLTTNDLDLTMDFDPDLDLGPFTGARTVLSEEDGHDQVLLFSETDQSFAALLLTREESANADAFFGRSDADVILPAGQANLTGNYVGTYVLGDTGFSGPMSGVLSLDVDFDEMTLNGGVTDRVIVLFDLPFTLNEEQDIVFPTMKINANGTFSAVGDRSIPSTDDPDRPIDITTEVTGAFAGGGNTGLEAAGEVVVETITTGTRGITTQTATSKEVGVFVVGHE